MKQSTYEAQVKKALEFYEKAGIIISPEEKTRIEVADFGLDDVENVGLQILTYINTERVCAKEMVLTPHQTCPEHKHVPSYGQAGKEETFRCRYGKVYLYIDGEPTTPLQGKVPEGFEDVLTVRHEIVLNPGEQFTIPPNTFHWFRAGDEGAVVSEFSTKSMDEFDIYTDKDIDPAGKRTI